MVYTLRMRLSMTYRSSASVGSPCSDGGGSDGKCSELRVIALRETFLMGFSRYFRSTVAPYTAHAQQTQLQTITMASNRCESPDALSRDCSSSSNNDVGEGVGD